MERQILALRRRAETLYGTLPYHNWRHASVDVWGNAQLLMERCRRYGVKYNPLVVEIGCILHDLGYALDPRDTLVEIANRRMFAPHREAIHSYLAARLMTRFGFDDSTIQAVLPTIDATHPDTLPTEANAIIVAAADTMLVGLGQYRQFATNGELLRQEIELLNGIELPKTAAVRGGMSFLGQFTARDLHLGPEYYTPEGISAWHLGAMHNIVRQCREAGLAKQVIVDLTSNGVPAASIGNDTSLTGDVLHISLGPNWKSRRRAMRQVTEHAKQLGMPAPIAIAIPDTPERLSLPGRLADTVNGSVAELIRLKNRGFDLTELRRVLKPGRPLTVYEVQAGHPTTPFTETHAFDRLDSWLSSQFSGKVIEETAYGTTATYVAN